MSTVEGVTGLQRRLAAISDPRMYLGTVAVQAVAEAKKLAQPFSKSNNLSASIRIGTITDTSAQILAGGQFGVGYARFVEFGTGIYGPRKRRIVPRNKPFMAWRVDTTGGVPGGAQLRLTGSSRTRKGQGIAGWAYARSTRGRPATPYLIPGARAALAEAGLTEKVIITWNGAD
jgi:hypothetical protein